MAKLFIIASLLAAAAASAYLFTGSPSNTASQPSHGSPTTGSRERGCSRVATSARTLVQAQAPARQIAASRAAAETVPRRSVAAIHLLVGAAAGSASCGSGRAPAAVARSYLNAWRRISSPTKKSWRAWTAMASTRVPVSAARP